MTDLIRKFSPFDFDFSSKLNRYIVFHHFLQQSELLYLVSQYLNVKDILNFSLSSKDLRFLVQIPYIEIRILKMKLQRYQNPQFNITNRQKQQLIEKYRQRLQRGQRSMLKINDKKKVASITRKLVDFTHPHQKMRVSKKIQNNNTLSNQLFRFQDNNEAAKTKHNQNYQNGQSKSEFKFIVNKKDKLKEKNHSYDIHKRYKQQIAKMRNQKFQYGEFVQQTSIKIAGNNIPLYRPKSCEQKQQKQYIIRVQNGKRIQQVPVVQIKAGQKVTFERQSRFNTYKVLSYLKNSIINLAGQ